MGKINFCPLCNIHERCRGPAWAYCPNRSRGKTWEIVATGFRNQYTQPSIAKANCSLMTPTWNGTSIRRGTAQRGLITSLTALTMDGEPVLGSLWISAQTLSEPWLTLAPGRQPASVSGMAQNSPPNTEERLFACDWSYELYAVHLKPRAPPIPQPLKSLPPPSPYPSRTCSLTLTMGPCTLRLAARVQSGLYRVTYIGNESTAPARSVPGGKLGRQDRHSLRPIYGGMQLLQARPS